MREQDFPEGLGRLSKERAGQGHHLLAANYRTSCRCVFHVV